MEYYHASGNSLAVFNLIAPGKVVTRGVIVDKIKAIAYHDIDKMQQFAESGHEDGSPYKFTDEPIKTAFGHMMCASLEAPPNNNRTLRRIVKPFDLAIFEKWRAWKIASPAVAASLLDSDVANFNVAFLSGQVGRWFVKTKKGRIGFAARGCRKGDQIAVLAGGKVPYVLRRKLGTRHEGHPCYTVLGDSYIHGAMDGEVFEQLCESEHETDHETEQESGQESEYESEQESGREIE
jgi:hypothetical protein